jgi:hypothetical protein
MLLRKQNVEHEALCSAIISLITLRDKWGFYASGLSDEERHKHAALKEPLTYAITLWLLDAYYTAHDTLKRNQITARRVRRKFPEDMSRDEIAKAVLQRLKSVKDYIDESHGLLNLSAKSTKESYSIAKQYFVEPSAFLNPASAEDGETLLIRLSSLIAEEDLF